MPFFRIITQKNIEKYFSKIAFLFLRYKDYLVDDFQSVDSFYSYLINFILDKSPFFFVVLEEKTENFTGFVFLDNFVGDSYWIYSAEITCCLEKKFWGDFTVHSAEKFLDYCFFVLGINKIKASIYPQNLYVRGILQKSGFRKEGLLKAETVRKNKFQDVEVYGLLKSDFERKKYED